MPAFEEEMLSLNKKKYELQMSHMKELHALELQKKQLELENLTLKNKLILKDMY